MVSPRKGQPMFPGGRLSLHRFLLIRIKIRSRAKIEGREQRISSDSAMDGDSLNSMYLGPSLWVCVLRSICLACCKQFYNQISASIWSSTFVEKELLFSRDSKLTLSNWFWWNSVLVNSHWSQQAAFISFCSVFKRNKRKV